MNDFTNPDLLRQRREEVAREVGRNRLARTLKAGRGRSGGNTFPLLWELQRMVGVLRKRLAGIRR